MQCKMRCKLHCKIQYAMQNAMNEAFTFFWQLSINKGGSLCFYSGDVTLGCRGSGRSWIQARCMVL